MPLKIYLGVLCIPWVLCDPFEGLRSEFPCCLCCFFLLIEPAPPSNCAPPVAQVIHEREVVTTIPPGDLKGVLFALPGCLQLTTEWGFQSATCPSCHGEALKQTLPIK